MWLKCSKLALGKYTNLQQENKSTAGTMDSRSVFKTLPIIYDVDPLFKEIQIALSKLEAIHVP